jgi:hypothetical protein
VDVLVASFADHEGLAFPHCHQPHPRRPFWPSWLVEIGEFADVADLESGAPLAHLALPGEEPMNQLVAPCSSHDRLSVGKDGGANTLTSAGGSSQRTMTWDFYPSGNQKARSDDGIPVGNQVVVVDSTDVNNTATQGNWDPSQAMGHWGYDVRTNAKGLGLESFTWQLNIPQDGTYEVFTRHGDVTGAATDAPFKITHASGEVTKPVDQTQRSGEWVSLGSYSFTESGTQKVTLSDLADGTVVADGLKLVRSNAGETDDEKKDFTYRYDVNGLLAEDKGAFIGKEGKLKQWIQDVVKNNEAKPNPSDGKDGWVYEGRVNSGPNGVGILSDMQSRGLSHKTACGIRVILFPDGSLRTAHPIP